MNPPGLSLLTFNIGNPSPERAQRQLAWLASRDEHVLVLTETKASAGCQLLAGAFTAAGYHVTYPEPGPGEYGTMIISSVAAAPDGFGDQIGYLPSRAAAVILSAPGGPLRVIGLYVPSRDASAEKTERKRKWLAACDAALASATAAMSAIVAGDLNILEPGHKPRYPFFAPFEYDFYQALADKHGLTDAFRVLYSQDRLFTWWDYRMLSFQKNRGLRIDAVLASEALAAKCTASGIDRELRKGKEPSDHAPIWAEFEV